MRSTATFAVLCVILKVVTGVAEYNLEETRILNGLSASPGMFPFIVYIDPDSSFSTTCVGSLISDRWVISSADCLSRAASFRVLIGSTRITVPDLGYVQSTGNYKVTDDTFMLGLLQLYTPVDVSGTNPYIGTIQMPDPSHSYVGNDVLLAGWGEVTGVPDILTYGYTKVEFLPGCDTLTSMQVCTSISAFYPCSTESGSPLVYMDSGVPVLVGVVGAFPNCLSPPSINSYIRVSAHLSWIEFVTGIKFKTS